MSLPLTEIKHLFSSLSIKNTIFTDEYAKIADFWSFKATDNFAAGTLVAAEGYPHLDLRVNNIGYNKHHPLNPNPQAGSVSRYVITRHGKTIGTTYTRRKLAVAAANRILKASVAAEVAEIKNQENERMSLYAANPVYGKF